MKHAGARKFWADYSEGKAAMPWALFKDHFVTEFMEGQPDMTPAQQQALKVAIRHQTGDCIITTGEFDRWASDNELRTSWSSPLVSNPSSYALTTPHSVEAPVLQQGTQAFCIHCSAALVPGARCCMGCRKPVAESLERLQANRSFLQLQEQHSDPANAPQTTEWGSPCTWSAANTQTCERFARHKCFDCSELLCDECMKVHKEGRGTRTHNVVALKPPPGELCNLSKWWESRTPKEKKYWCYGGFFVVWVIVPLLARSA
jgi:hypothetical protein